jgi:hypothetical protein
VLIVNIMRTLIQPRHAARHGMQAAAAAMRMTPALQHNQALLLQPPPLPLLLRQSRMQFV